MAEHQEHGVAERASTALRHPRWVSQHWWGSELSLEILMDLEGARRSPFQPCSAAPSFPPWPWQGHWFMPLLGPTARESVSPSADASSSGEPSSVGFV